MIYRGYRKVDQQPVILKLIKPISHLREVARLFGIHTGQLPDDWRRSNRRLVLVLEDFGGQALHEVIAQGLEVGRYWIGISLAETLGGVASGDRDP